LSDKIKTREILKDIKVVDKAGNAANRMRNAYIRTKDEAQNTQQSEYNSPTEYATYSTTQGMGNTVYKTIHQVKKQTDNIIDKVKESRNIKNATEKTIKTAPKVGKTIKQSAKDTGESVKTTSKGTIKTAQKSFKTVEKTAKATIKTSQQTAKVTVKTAQATAKTTRATMQSAQAATKAAVTTAKAAVKAIIAAIQELVSLIVAGGWIAVVIILIVCMAAMIFASPFGIFSGGGENGTPTIKEVTATVNSEWDSKIEKLENNVGNVGETVITINGTVVTSAQVQNWADVLSVYSVMTSTGENPADIAELGSNRISILKSIFNDMNTISSKVEETTDENNNVITKLTIDITSKSYIDMISLYNLNSKQQAISRELMSNKNKSMWQQMLE
jgi:predicted CoA-binding protein